MGHAAIQDMGRLDAARRTFAEIPPTERFLFRLGQFRLLNAAGRLSEADRAAQALYADAAGRAASQGVRIGWPFAPRSSVV